MAFLKRQFDRLGYETFVLACGGRIGNCNSRVNKSGLAHRLECYKCRAGGIKSFVSLRPSWLDVPVPLDDALLQLGHRFAFSTAATALQVEHPRETRAGDFAGLQAALGRSAATAYVNARRWIRDNALDCVFLFNGRFDLVRSILEACLAEKVRFVSFERSWFGSGMQLLPDENCLGLKNFHALSSRWASRPLTYGQAASASKLITRRLTRSSVGEWRQYNVSNNLGYSGDRIKYLFLPSSQHEWLGDVDRASGWEHPTDGVEYLFRRMGVSLSELVVRGHPGWAMKISHYGPNRATGFYRDWAQRVGARFIEPAEPLDSHELMKRSDLILVNGSSASMEAAWIGRPVVSLVPAAFSASGISRNLFAAQAIDALSPAELAWFASPSQPEEQRRLQCTAALRYIYCANYRLFQFVDSLRSTSAYAFEAAEPADLSGLESLALRGLLQENDARFAPDGREEREVVDAILAGNHGSIREVPVPGSTVSREPMKRRIPYRLIDLVTP